MTGYPIPGEPSNGSEVGTKLHSFADLMPMRAALDERAAELLLIANCWPKPS
jgi:hypothetical protein